MIENKITRFEYLYNKNERFRTLCIQYEYATQTEDDDHKQVIEQECFAQYNIDIRKEQNV